MMIMNDGYFTYTGEKAEKRGCILLWSPSCVNWMVAYLGALLNGDIVVPLDVNSKEEFLCVTMGDTSKQPCAPFIVYMLMKNFE